MKIKCGISGIPTVPAIVKAREALMKLGLYRTVSPTDSGGIYSGADAVAIGIAALLAPNYNKEILGSKFEEEIGASAGQCPHCHTGKCPVGIATQASALVARLDTDEAAERVANFINSMTMEVVLITRSLGKGDAHSLEPEDTAALAIETSAMARIPWWRQTRCSTSKASRR